MKYLPYILYPQLAAIALPLRALAWLLAPFLSLYSVINHVNTLPGRWQWWSTVDETLDGGIDQFEYPDYSQRGPFIVWLYRTRWICRNPAQGFMYHLFSVPDSTENPPHIVYDYGDSDVNGINSRVYRVASDSLGRQYFSLKGKWWPVKWLGLRYNLGWKLYQAQGYRMLVFSIALRFNF